MKKVFVLFLMLLISVQASFSVYAAEDITIVGILKSASFEDGVGNKNEFLFVKLDKPQIFKVSYESDLIDIETDEVQVSINNFSDEMIDKKVEIRGNDMFAAHTFYHRRDVVFINTTAKIIESNLIANENDELSNTKINYATEYKKIVDDLINKYGVSTYSNSYEYSDGVLHCELMDFDGNGSPEMYVLLKRATDDEYCPEYLHQIYSYNNGTASLVLENSGKIHADLWNFKFYTKDGKVYLFEELSRPCLDMSFNYGYSSYYTYSSIKEFDGSSFTDVWVYSDNYAGAPTKEELLANGYTDEAGYQTSYVKNDWGNYYFSVKASVIQNGIRKSINLTSDNLNVGSDELTAFVGKDNYLITNDRVYDNAVYYLEYTTGGEYPVENVDCNTASFSAKLQELSLNLKDDNINVVVNGKTVAFDQKPIVLNGRTLVPMRAIFEALGAKVEWENETQTATAIKDGVIIEIQIDSNSLKKNGVNIELDVPARLVGDRTLVPARAISEAFGLHVNWEENTNTVQITNN